MIIVFACCVLILCRQKFCRFPTARPTKNTQTVRQPRTMRLHLFLMVKTDQLTKKRYTDARQNEYAQRRRLNRNNP